MSSEAWENIENLLQLSKLSVFNNYILDVAIIIISPFEKYRTAWIIHEYRENND